MVKLVLVKAVVILITRYVVRPVARRRLVRAKMATLRRARPSGWCTFAWRWGGRAGAHHAKWCKRETRPRIRRSSEFTARSTSRDERGGLHADPVGRWADRGSIYCPSAPSVRRDHLGRPRDAEPSHTKM